MNEPRRQCNLCLRPVKTCICDLVRRIENTLPVLIIQHPLEVKHSKNTARLAHLCLTNSRLLVAETLSPQDIAQYLTPYNNLLLYPENSESQNNLPTADNTKPCQLVVLDGTWRKTRKLLHCNPVLHTLKRYAIKQAVTSNYAIRKAQKKNQLSTLEAIGHSLTDLEHTATRFQPLFKAFSDFIDKQQRFITRTPL